MRWANRFTLVLAVGVLSGAATAHAFQDDPAAMTQEEEDQIRDAQDPSVRIATYLTMAGTRLERFSAIRQSPPDPSNPAVARSAELDRILSQYIALDDELKHWIEDQYTTNHDMRKGLRAVIEVGPKQLAILNQVEQTPDRYVSDYHQTLRDAITDLNDTINGATQALADQEKKFGELKRQEVADAKAAKEATAAEKKRQKQEQKLRKKQSKQGVPEDEDQQN